MIQDIDIDVARLLDKVPDDHVMFCFRCGSPPPDFVYIRGNLDDMIETLANIMNKYEEIAELIVESALKYQE